MNGKANAPVPTPIYRKQNPVAYVSAGTAVPVKLYRSLLYRFLALELTGAATTTIANNTAANTAIGDEWGCVTNIDISVNGSDHLRNFSGDDLWWLNAL